MKKINYTYIKHSFLVGLIILTAFFSFNVCSFAAGNNENSVVISIEAFTVDYGFILEPTLVQFTTADNGAMLMEKAFNASNINSGSGTGNYISSIALETDFININSYVYDALSENNISGDTDVVKSGWLAEFDYTKQSGWIFIVNNKIIASGIADYKPAAGDVIRLAFSVYGSGADLAVSTTGSPLGNVANIFADTNRDNLFKAMAQYYADSDFELDTYVESVATDLLSNQEEIDSALDFMNGMIYDVETDENDSTDEDEIETDEEETDTEEETEPDFAEPDDPNVTTTPSQTSVPNTSYDEYINNIPKAESAPTGVTLPVAGFVVFLLLSVLSGLAAVLARKLKK